MSEIGASAGNAQSDSRPNGDGVSIRPKHQEFPTRIDTLSRDLEIARKELVREQSEHKLTKSKMRTQESDLMEENHRLKSQVKSLSAEIASLKSQTTPRQLHGTPELVVGPTNASEKKTRKLFIQRLLTKLSQYTEKTKQLTLKLRQQNQQIQTLKDRESKSRGIRRPGPLFAESGAASSQAGPSTNTGFTLSLASPNPSTHTQRVLDAESSSSLHKAERRVPVERSDHEYSNAQECLKPESSVHTLGIGEGASRLTDTSTSSNRRPPKPMPRTRSLAVSTMKPVTESLQEHTFEIVNRPQQDQIASQRPHYNFHDASTIRDVGTMHADLTAHPQQLSQRVVDIPVPVLPATSRECGVCNQRFPHLTNSMFMEHCLKCADEASEEVGIPSVVHPVQDSTNLKICPVCNQNFDAAVSQSDYENHVQGHFPDDDGPTGWEVTAH